MRVLFVCQDDFSAPTEKQVLGFAEELTRRGHEVMVSIARDLSTAAREGADGVPRLTVQRHEFVGPRLRGGSVGAVKSFQPTLIHAFLSRVPVVAAAAGFAKATDAPVFVHFGDDEWRLPPGLPGESLYYRAGRLGRRVVSRAHPPSWPHSTPRSLGWVERNARALDALTPALASEVSSRLGRDCTVVLPAMPRIEPSEGGLTPAPIRKRLPAGPIALFTGSILREYLSDVLLGMRAIAEVQARGQQLSFVHAGAIHRRIDPGRLAAEAGLRDGTAHFLGYLPLRTMPSLLAAASILLQPGAPTDFNRLRLPAKLQLYLASGRPTVTFATGFGELLADRREVLKTHTDAPAELADRLIELLTDQELAGMLSRNGPVAAERLFDPVRNTDALVAHYRAGLASGREAPQSSLAPAD